MNRLLARFNIDPYLLLLVSTVAFASVLPARGVFADIAGGVADAGIALLFFLHGAKLSREAIVDGARAWKLHVSVASLTFVLFPLIGLAVSAIPGLDPALATGVLFLTLLPSTVQSSIAFTAIAGGNVAAAVCSASFSNLAGIFVTPLLTAVLITGKQGGFSSDPVITISMQLLLPFLAGHFLRPWIGEFVARHKKVLGYTDRGSILLVVYTAFGAAVIDGLWSRVTIGELALIAGISIAILALVLLAANMLGRAMRFSREDLIVLVFCGSKKSLATGVPLAGVLFTQAQVGAIILPLMFFHQIQLMVCAILARRYAAQTTREAIA
ncbi:bile acid:sodium symporter family protein [Novosphingobium pentaromativorans]|uniref:Bile acid:sodium symporter n=1 Tax=Novosphingobium pentaromativorans US6-1 TaxID=1088721 RepID=G6EEF5_9SPHN|nr:bile acid:sodium symporter family protein [Novosphingobium pentaromativorans]AIT79453.1 bile acid:sodium symporter [Novosphingobium pentaromativorans US6-1]EHJ60378.1 bile acid:sodium symporter [Novosphingobium pentaromativorans US6-1]